MHIHIPPTIISTPSRIEIYGTPWRVAMSNTSDEASDASVALDVNGIIGQRGIQYIKTYSLACSRSPTLLKNTVRALLHQI